MRNLTKNEAEYVWKILNKKRIPLIMAFPEIVFSFFIIYFPVASSLNKSGRFFIINFCIFVFLLSISLIIGIIINKVPKKFSNIGKICTIKGIIKKKLNPNGYSYAYSVGNQTIDIPWHLLLYGFIKENDSVELECWKPDAFLLYSYDAIVLSVNGIYKIDKDVKNGILKRKNKFGIFFIIFLISFLISSSGILFINKGYKDLFEYVRFLKYNCFKKTLSYNNIEEFLKNKPGKYRKFKINDFFSCD